MSNINGIFPLMNVFQEKTTSAVAWPSHARMVSTMPATPETKTELVEIFTSNNNSVFTSQVVHMLMVVLTVFGADDIDKTVRDVHTVAESMLRTHLNSEQDHSTVLRCLSFLPRMVRLKHNMVEDLRKQMHHMQQPQRTPI